MSLPIVPDRCKGQRWVVTGGTRGLGWELVRTVAREGGRVVYCGRGEPEPLERGAEEAGAVHFVRADVSREEDVDRLFDEADDHLQGITTVVNNAGRSLDRLLVDTTLDEWNDVIGLNLRSVYLVMRRAVEELLSDGGCIVNVGSIAANGLVGQGAYAASKSALVSMTRAVAKEYGSRKVRCNLVVPGFFDTRMTASMSPEQRKHVESLSPERRFAEVGEVVEAILFLASDQATFVTGDELWVSGGVRDVPRLFRS